MPNQAIKTRARSALRALCLLAAGAVALAAPAGAETASKARSMTAAPTKPNGSGIGVSYRIEGLPRAGQATTVIVVLDRITDPDGALVRFTADPDLALRNAPAGPAPLTAGQTATFELTVVPAADGLRYLNVFTTQNGVTGSTSIPVQAGNPSRKQGAGTLKHTPEGDAILSMPVK